MIAMDPPDHNVYRRLVSPSLSAASVRNMEPRIRATVTRIFDRIAPLGKCEFVKEVAAELPLTVLSDLLGVPAQDRHLLFEWTNMLTEMTTDIISGLAAFNQVITYGQQMFERLRACPLSEDLLSIMAHAKIGGVPIDQQFLDGFFLLIVIAGNETTRNTISGGTLALIEHPDQRELLRANPELLPSAIEEILRWVTPVIHFRRTATADTEIRGQTIREGEKVVMWYPSANRDEDAFAEPDRFDIRRAPNEHLAFGEGEHFCLGAWLARLELRVLFEELIRRMPEVRLDGEVKRLRSYFLSGITHMPVAFG
jgi:cytochrome P450